MDPPPAAMSDSELEAAIAALPAKKEALREAFDRLASCSPSPISFCWEDLDSYISSLHSSFSLRFRQLCVLKDSRPTPVVSLPGSTLVDGNTKNPDEGEETEGKVATLAEDDAGWESMEEEADEELNNKCNREEDAVMEVEEADGETRDVGYEMGKNNKELEEEPEELDDEADNETRDTHGELGSKREEGGKVMEESDEMGKMTHGASKIYPVDELVAAREIDPVDELVAAREIDRVDELVAAHEEPPDAKYVKKASNYEAKEKANEEDQDVNMEDVVVEKLSVSQNKDEVVEEQEAHDANEEKQDAKAAMKMHQMQDKKGELAGDMNVFQEQGDSALPGSSSSGCASMNNRWLVKSVCDCITLGQDLPIGIHCHPDAAEITLRVVKLFLHNKVPKTNNAWVKCVTLFRNVSEAAAKPSAAVMEQAKQVAKDWKEMIENPASSLVLGNLESWGFLYFLICYNIVSEFDADEIIRLFSTVPRKKQKKNTIKLLKDLGLADRITDLIDYLIGNGQLMDGLNLAHPFKLVDKYPPLSILKGYVEKAKQTAIEILGKNMTCKSQDSVIQKEVNNLRDALDVVKKYVTDSSQCSTITADIVNLLHEYGKKKRSSANSSIASTTHLQPQSQSNVKRKKEELEQEHCEGQKENSSIASTTHLQQQKQSNVKRKKEELEQEHCEGQKENSSIASTTHLQQQKQSNVKRKKEELEQEHCEGQKEKQGRVSKPGEKLQRKQNGPQQKQGTDNQKKKVQETQQGRAKGPRPHAPKRSKHAAHWVPYMEPIGHYGHTRYAAVHGLHGHPAQPWWPEVHGMPFAPHLGAPQYLEPYDPFYPHPQFYFG